MTDQTLLTILAGALIGYGLLFAAVIHICMADHRARREYRQRLDAQSTRLDD